MAVITSNRPDPVFTEHKLAAATRCGWFAFEGLGRPYEAWVQPPGASGWRSLGRCLTRRGAQSRARAWLRRHDAEWC